MKPFGFASMIAAIAQPFAAYGNSRIEVGNAVVMVAVRGHDAELFSRRRCLFQPDSPRKATSTDAEHRSFSARATGLAQPVKP
jgi:hypothetical protein